MPVKKKSTIREQELQRQNEDLRLRLQEAEETLRAIREGEVDAVIVSGAKGQQVFSLVGADAVYRLIVETMKEAAFTVAFDGTILFCNAQFGEFVKRPTELIVGHPLQEFVDDDNQAAATALLLFAQRQPVKQRLVFQDLNCQPIPAHVSANVLSQPDGLSICVVATDLTQLENSTELIQQLRRQQEALHASEQRYRTLFDSLQEGFYIGETIFDKAGKPSDFKYVGANPAFERLLGLPQDQIVGHTARELIPDLKPGWLETFGRVQLTGEPAKYDGYSKFFKKHFEAFAFRPAQGQVAVLVTDITDRMRGEAALQASVREKDVLLREVHHRVKNNLQILSSLMNLQADTLDNPELRVAFDDLRDQVRSMALVHEKLYQSESLSHVDFAEYARDLLAYLWRAYRDKTTSVRLTLELQPVEISITAAVPCGLILNELVTNAIKYAFRDRSNGVVTVALHADPDGNIHLCVSDNGIGFPAGLDWRHTRSLGLRLVQMLGKQLGGTVDMRQNNGTEVEIIFKNPTQESHDHPQPV